MAASETKFKLLVPEIPFKLLIPREVTMQAPTTTKEVGKELLTRREVAAMLGIAPKTFDRWRAAGVGPRPVKLPGKHFPRWRRSDVNKWVDKLAQAKQ